MLQNRKVVLSSKAYLSITAETYSFSGVETGGIFLGKVRDNIWYVLEIVDPGYNNTVRRPAYFEYDRHYVTHLANVRSRLYSDGVDLLGLWHRHPGGFDRFSPTDNETNIRFAELHSYGAISAIVNLDPDFRMTIYHVSLPLQYTRLYDVVIGDSYIPKELCRLKKPEDFTGTRTRKIKTNSDNGFLKKLFAVHKDKQVLQSGSHQYMAMEMMESELDNYLDKQADYSYDIKIVGNSVKIKMSYLGKMPYYPEDINCRFFVENDQKFCMINDQKKIYFPGVIKKFVDRYINAMILGDDDVMKKEITNQTIHHYAKILGLEGKFGIDDIKKAYRMKMKDYHPDTWQHEGSENLNAAATHKSQKIQEAYNFIMEEYNDKR